MNWQFDQATEVAARQYPHPLLEGEPVGQFAGRTFRPASWHRRTLHQQWPAGEQLLSSPNAIIELFRAGAYLEARAMVVSWGTMSRGSAAIWGGRDLGQIEQTLTACAASIQRTGSLECSWAALTRAAPDGLGWTAVAASKTLHFLARSLGFEERPPVALDGAVIRDRVWPAFIAPIRRGQRPQGWRGNDFEAYARYMTAICIWAELRGWTTTQMEATLFHHYRLA